jgi:hypothetical protein
MNLKAFFFAALISSLLSCNAQQLQTRPVSAFNKIQASGAISINYTQSDSLALSVKAKSSDLDKIETRIENSTLILSTKGNFSGPVTIYVKNNTLNSVAISGASDFRTTNVIQTGNMDLNASGSSNAHLKVAGKNISCLQAGASNITLNGTADSLHAEVSGASSLKAYGLSTKNIKVTTTGASTAKVFATETLKANATGASDIKIKGDPKEVSAEASTAASISRVKDSESKNIGGSDTTTYSLKRKKVMVITDGEKDEETKSASNNIKHWRGFSMGINGYMSKSGGMNMPKTLQFLDLNYARSLNFQFNIIERNFNLVQNYFKVVTGFGFDYHIYALANRTDLNPDTSYTWGTMDGNPGQKYLKNRLRCTYLQVPLLLEFNTSNDPEKTFHVAFGVIGQYLISSRTKQVIEEDGYEYKKIKKDDYNMSPFAAKAHINLGYKNWTIFSEYSLTSLFQPGKGPELYPFTAGIRLIHFSS